ncbi:hypothetical protein FKP32DRAFT_1578785 [Trametes sanguinea]|nr:hypothetical protein FKP32DRAFT_1578785 [Trametes sanguinea]
MNHFLALVVDELLDFWDPGVWYTRTSMVPTGRRVHAAMIPLVCDLLAARQLAGLGQHNHTFMLCSFCGLPKDDINNTDPDTFPPRDLEAHRRAAEAWRDAESTHERELLFKRTGIRYTELLRLPYWNPILYVVVDTMHNLYLGLIKRHIRDIWGMTTEKDDGDALGSRIDTAPPRPTDEDMSAGLDALLYGSDKALSRCKKAVLFHLCADRDLRVAGTIAQLVKILGQWVSECAPSSDSHISSEDLMAVRKTFCTANKPSTFKKYRKDVLIAFCRECGLDAEGTRVELAQRFLAWVQQVKRRIIVPARRRKSQKTESPGSGASSSDPSFAGASPIDTKSAKTKTSGTTQGGALGITTLSAFVDDASRMELPTWVNRAPPAFGTKRNGKLSADQWRTVGIINLPVTLIRTWGAEVGLHALMLRNYLDLVDAVETMGLLETNEDEIERAEEALERYLDGLKTLYLNSELQPNHHLALHIGMFLRLFGPVHSWRAFAFERFNYMLQSINASNVLGQLEVTFMMHSCRAANLRPLLRAEPVQSMMQEFVETHRRISGEDRRGMRFDDLLRTAEQKPPRGDPGKSPKRCVLQENMLSALCGRFNEEAGCSRYCPTARLRQKGQILLSSNAVMCSKVSIDGVLYKAHRRSAGDSNVIIRPPNDTSTTYPARIEQIVLYNRVSVNGEYIEDTIIFVRLLAKLSESDRANDPFRRYPHVGGSLYYNHYDENIIALRPRDIVCHFARTRMDHLRVQRRVRGGNGEGYHLEDVHFERPCVHVRPLDRVSHLNGSGVENCAWLILGTGQLLRNGSRDQSMDASGLDDEDNQQ